ncbi:MAG: hypothetical protein KY447_00220 [Actinobacteria bacterium]|nr:hypothetical protein [Actinomycetota bacterium]
MTARTTERLLIAAFSSSVLLLAMPGPGAGDATQSDDCSADLGLDSP